MRLLMGFMMTGYLVMAALAFHTGGKSEAFWAFLAMSQIWNVGFLLSLRQGD